ncbi:MAG TPA: hypothetical protein VFZ17_07070 [Acidimicrobiia bacterium]|nr:hypothetical protein [Acidimicrobiia bacterium]
MRRVVGVLLVVGVAISSVTPRADAQSSGGGELGPGYVRATAADLGAGTFTGGGLPAASPSTEPPFRWVRVVHASVCVVFAGDPPAGSNPVPVPGPSFGFPLRPGPAVGVPAGTVIVGDAIPLPPDAVVVGTFVQEVGDDPTVDGDIVIIPRCIQPGEPPLANPPSAAAIWQETPLPRAVVRASPPGTRAWPGITRLGSDFRSDGLGPTMAAVSLDGYDVEVTAVPIAYAWSFGDGTDVVTPDAGPPRRVAYLRRGDFTVTRYVVWEGTAHLTAFGGDFGTKYLGTVTIPERVLYHVAELRAVLRSTPGRP